MLSGWMTGAELHPDAQSSPGHVMSTEPHSLVSTIAVSLGTASIPREAQPKLVLMSTQRRCSMVEILHSFQVQPSPTATELQSSHSLRLKTLMNPLVSPCPLHTWPCSWRERESSLFSWAASFSCSSSSSSCSRSFSFCRCAMEAITSWITGKGRAVDKLARFPPQSLPPAV